MTNRRRLPGRVRKRLGGKGFTLIELLIVVAIIAILAAIAVPNFLEAQVRAKVSRVMGDMRTVSIALGAYHVDHQRFPPSVPPSGALSWHMRLVCLTTPIAYLSTYECMRDIFNNDVLNEKNVGETYGEERVFFYREERSERENYPSGYYIWSDPESISYNKAWRLMSWGPDRRFTSFYDLGGDGISINVLYDPTNGTKSAGDIYRHGP